MIRKIAELPQQQQVLLALLGAAALFMIWYYPISSIQNELEGLNGRVEALNQEIMVARQTEARLREFQKEVEVLENELAELKAVLPDEKETAEIVRRVEELAKNSNLDIKNFTPQGTVRYDFYEDWPIRMSIEGSYSNLGLFFQRVANFQRIINIDNIEIRALGGTDRRRSISATCTATTFVFLEEEEG